MNIRNLARRTPSRGLWAAAIAIAVAGIVAGAAGWPITNAKASANAAEACAPVTCVVSADDGYCACRPGGEVCAGQRSVTACAPRVTTGTCCVSAGFCYCTDEAKCWSPEDVSTDRCDATLTPSTSCEMPVVRAGLGSGLTSATRPQKQ